LLLAAKIDKVAAKIMWSVLVFIINTFFVGRVSCELVEQRNPTFSTRGLLG